MIPRDGSGDDSKQEKRNVTQPLSRSWTNCRTRGCGDVNKRGNFLN